MTEVITELKRLEPDAYERLKAEGRIIVRCRGCKYGRRIYGCFEVHCNLYETAMPNDGYCWRGEES